jgi:hypothetical protein
LYPVSDITGVKDEMSECQARRGEKGIKNFEGKREGKRLNGRPSRRREGNIKGNRKITD